jgi:hypothetical protein
MPPMNDDSDHDLDIRKRPAPSSYLPLPVLLLLGAIVGCVVGAAVDALAGSFGERGNGAALGMGVGAIAGYLVWRTRSGKP